MHGTAPCAAAVLPTSLTWEQLAQVHLSPGFQSAGLTAGVGRHSVWKARWQRRQLIWGPHRARRATRQKEATVVSYSLG